MKFNKENALIFYRIMIEYQQSGFNMTTRELADAVGLKSNSGITRYTRWLVARGYAKQKGKQIHAIPQGNDGGTI